MSAPNIDLLSPGSTELLAALENLEWTNARATNITIGKEDHGLITSWVYLEGDGWGQGFGGRYLARGHLQGWIEGLLSLGLDINARDQLVRVGRVASFSEALALRPIVKDWPVFWPGSELASRTYSFDYEGKEIPMQGVRPDKPIKSDGREAPRKSVLRMAHLMEAKLREHDDDRGETGWREESPRWVSDRLRGEMHELVRAFHGSGDGRRDLWLNRLMGELADVANFCMMLADLYDFGDRVVSPDSLEQKGGEQ